MKVTRLRDADNIYTTTDYNWAPLTLMKHIIDALINFSMINTALWPYDMCSQMLMKLYNKCWIGYSIKEERNVAFICKHFRRVFGSQHDQSRPGWHKPSKIPGNGEATENDADRGGAQHLAPRLPLPDGRVPRPRECKPRQRSTAEQPARRRQRKRPRRQRRRPIRSSSTEAGHGGPSWPEALFQLKQTHRLPEPAPPTHRRM